MKPFQFQKCKEDSTLEKISIYFISLKDYGRKTKYSHLTRQLKNILEYMKKSSQFKDDKSQYCKDLFLLKLISASKANPNQIPMGFFMEFDKVF